MTPPETASLFDLVDDARATPGPVPEPVVDPGQALAEAADKLARQLAAGRWLSASALTSAMREARRLTDSRGRSWNSKLCYDAAEAATVLFLRQWGAAMRDAADSPEALLAMIERVAALEPTHTHRSEHQVGFDQFSTPLPLACAAFLAADVRPGDTVLEPSAGTGVLAALASTAVDDASRLHLNELSPVRHALLAAIYPDASVTKHNAEHIRDRLPRVRPDLVLMNPPFAARPTIGKRRRHVDLKHLRSAYAALAPCGRLVAVTAANCVPDSTAWRDAFGTGPAAPRILFAARIPAALYRRRGTGVETRLVVLERASAAPADRYPALDPFAVVDDAADLARRVAALPDRLILDPEPRALDIRDVEWPPDATPGNGSSTWSPWAPASFRVPGVVEHPPLALVPDRNLARSTALRRRGLQHDPVAAVRVRRPELDRLLAPQTERGLQPERHPDVRVLHRGQPLHLQAPAPVLVRDVAPVPDPVLRVGADHARSSHRGRPPAQRRHPILDGADG